MVQLVLLREADGAVHLVGEPRDDLDRRTRAHLGRGGQQREFRRAALQPLHGRVDEQRRADLLERFRLDPTRRGSTYSRGNRQKVALVAAFAAGFFLAGIGIVMPGMFIPCID